MIKIVFNMMFKPILYIDIPKDKDYLEIRKKMKII